MHCELDVCIQFSWTAIILYFIIKCRENPGKKSQWTLSMDGVDNVHGLNGLIGHCPLTQWTLSIVSMDIVHGLSGHCPWTDIPIFQPDNVH